MSSHQEKLKKLHQHFRQAVFEEILEEIRIHLRKRIQEEESKWLWGFKWCAARAYKAQLNEFEENINSYRSQFARQAAPNVHGERDFSQLSESLQRYFSVPQSTSAKVVPQNTLHRSIHSYQAVVHDSRQDVVDLLVAMQAPDERAVSMVSKVGIIANNSFISRSRDVCNFSREKESAITLESESYASISKNNNFLHDKIRGQLALLYEIKNIITKQDEEICSCIPAQYFRISGSERQTVREILKISQESPLMQQTKKKAYALIQYLKQFLKQGSSIEKRKIFFEIEHCFHQENITVIDHRAVSSVSSADRDSASSNERVLLREPGAGLKLFDHAGTQQDWLKTKQACAEKACEYILQIIQCVIPGFSWSTLEMQSKIEKFVDANAVFDEPSDQYQAHAMILVNIFSWCQEICSGQDVAFKGIRSQFFKDQNTLNNLRCGLLNYLDPNAPKDYNSQKGCVIPNTNIPAMQKLQKISQELFPQGLEEYLKDLHARLFSPSASLSC